MKRLVCLMASLCILLVGCDGKGGNGEGDESVRFKVVGDADIDMGDYIINAYIVYDTETNVEYFLYKGSYGSSLSPLYDKNGEVMKYIEDVQ